MKLRKTLKIIVVLLLGLFLFAGMFLLYHHTQVAAITIQGASKNQDIRSVQLLKGQSFFLVDTARVEREILAANPLVRAITVQKMWPNEVIISITNHTPIARLQVGNGYFILSEDATILEKTREKTASPLTEISYYQNFDYHTYQPGAYLNYKDIVSSIFFLQKALELNLRIDNIDINGLNMIVFSLQDKRILFTTEKSLESQLYELQSIIRQFKVEGKDFEELDLRFDRPIVRTLQQ